MNLKAEIGKRLSEFIKTRKWKKYQFAELVGIQPTHVNNYLSGEYDPVKLIDKLLSFGHINSTEKNWLLTGSENDLIKIIKPIDIETGIDGAIPLVKYPVLAEVFAGPAELLDAQVVSEYKEFEYKSNSNRCFAVKVNGESMDSTLPHGTTVLVDMDSEIIEDDIVVVRLSNGNQYIKRFHNVSKDLIELSSDNSNYARKLISKDDIEVIFPVVEYSVKLKRQKSSSVDRSGKNNGRKGLSLS